MTGALKAYQGSSSSTQQFRQLSHNGRVGQTGFGVSLYQAIWLVPRFSVVVDRNPIAQTMEPDPSPDLLIATGVVPVCHRQIVAICGLVQDAVPRRADHAAAYSHWQEVAYVLIRHVSDPARGQNDLDVRIVCEQLG